jgi:hypothetical protein
VLADLADGYISRSAARDTYGADFTGLPED